MFTSVQAEIPNTPLSIAATLSPIELARYDTRYALASLEHSSGFVVAPEDLPLEEAPNEFPQGETFGLEPDFKQHSRYWLYTHVVNHTNRSDWVVHVSNFGFQQPKVMIRSANGQVVKTIDNSGYLGSTDINTIGRAVDVDLEPGDSYLVVVELNARLLSWNPYIALMSGQQYEAWKTQMDFAFKLAIGAILAFVVLGFSCWMLTTESTFFWAALSSLLMLLYYLEHSNLPIILWQWDYERTAFLWLLISATLFSQLAFAASFLQINRNSGLWYRIFAGTALVTLLVYLATTMVPIKVKLLLYAFNYTVVWLVILSSGVAKVWKEGRYYIIYILGWLPLVLSIFQVLWTLHGPQRAPQEIDVSYKMISVLYVQLLHMFLHTIALILRIKTLREDKLKAEYVSQAKSRFIAQSSHDLNQPLHSMRIFLDYLKPHVQGTDGNKIFYRLKKTHRQMTESFKAIMDLSKLEAGVIRPERKPVCLSGVFRRLEHEFGMLAAEKNILLKFHPCSLTVFSDPLLLERMLTNLLSNAIKYTDTGKVVVGYRQRNKHVVFQIMDTGRGIDKNAHIHIFDIYHRSDNHPGQTDGSGIGLSIVKQIAELLNHPLEMESIPGRGSSFKVTVPLFIKGTHSFNETIEERYETPVVALVFQRCDLGDALFKRIEDWRYSVLAFSSLEEALKSAIPVSVLLCDQASLNSAALTANDAEELAQHLVAACLCEPGTSVPTGWTTLSEARYLSQVRALLNVVARRAQTDLSVEHLIQGPKAERC